MYIQVTGMTNLYCFGEKFHQHLLFSEQFTGKIISRQYELTIYVYFAVSSSGWGTPTPS